MSISMVKIRARITIGSLAVETPYIKSFTVNQTRGQVSTFNASVQVSHANLATSLMQGAPIKIEAGENSPQHVVFSGIVKSVTISPVFDDPSFALINLSGADILSTLNGKKFTRRCRATKSTWITIDNVIRQGLRSSKFKAKKSDIITLINTDLNREDEHKGAVALTDSIKNSPGKSQVTNSLQHATPIATLESPS